MTTTNLAESKSEKASFSNYGRTFQEKLTMLLLDDRVFSDRMSEVLNVEYLELKYLQLFTKLIFDYKIKYKVHPVRETMETLLKSGLSEQNEVVQKQIVDFYTRFASTTEIPDAEFVKDQALDFCRKQKLHEAMLKSVNLLKTSSFDEISTLINGALKAGADCDVGKDFIKDFEQRYIDQVRNTITTGWERMDDVSQGGLGKKELGVVIAPTGAGKSMALIHLGAQALKQGKVVVYYTLELAADQVALRFDSCLTGIPIDELRQNKDKVYNGIKNIPGGLTIKEYPKKRATTQTIINHLEKLKQSGVKPDMIILDYADLLRPIVARKEIRDEIGTIYEEFESILQMYNAIGWTASQTNRTGLDEEVITMKAIADAFNKCFGASLIFSLSRTMHDRENNTGRIFLAKNRFGPDQQVWNIFMDPGNVDIKILDKYDAEKDSGAQVDLAEQKRRMQEKFKKFKKKGGGE